MTKKRKAKVVSKSNETLDYEASATREAVTHLGAEWVAILYPNSNGIIDAFAGSTHPELAEVLTVASKYAKYHFEKSIVDQLVRMPEEERAELLRKLCFKQLRDPVPWDPAGLGRPNIHDISHRLTDSKE